MVPFYTPCKHQKNKGFEKKFCPFKNLTLKIFFSSSVRLLLNILSNVTIKPTRKTHFEKTVYNIEWSDICIKQRQLIFFFVRVGRSVK